MRQVLGFVVLMAVFSIGIAAFKYSTILGVAIWLLAFYLFAKIGSGGWRNWRRQQLFRQ